MKRKIMLAAVFLAGFSLLNASAVAAGLPDNEAPSVSDKKLHLVEELFVTMQMKQMMDNMMATMLNRMDLTGGRVLSAQQEAAVNSLMGSLRRGMARLTPEVLNAMAPVYARTFSETELRDVIAFYKSPSGKSFLEKGTAVMAEALASISPVMPKYVDYAEEDFCAQRSCGNSDHEMFDKMRQGVAQMNGKAPAQN
jgi:hypothetical protein